jgi:hypothetical protein
MTLRWVLSEYEELIDLLPRVMEYFEVRAPDACFLAMVRTYTEWLDENDPAA